MDELLISKSGQLKNLGSCYLIQPEEGGSTTRKTAVELHQKEKMRLYCIIFSLKYILLNV